MTGREALLAAFDQLFDAAAAKLQVTCTPEERTAAKAQFERRFEQALVVTDGIDIPALPQEIVDEMRSAIERISPAELAGVLASIPLAQQTQEMVRMIAYRAAEQRLLEHMASQADTRFGGN